jgi:hypothetical protein
MRRDGISRISSNRDRVIEYEQREGETHVVERKVLVQDWPGVARDLYTSPSLVSGKVECLKESK